MPMNKYLHFFPPFGDDTRPLSSTANDVSGVIAPSSNERRLLFVETQQTLAHPSDRRADVRAPVNNTD